MNSDLSGSAATCVRAIHAFRARQALVSALVLFCAACGTKDERGDAGTMESLKFAPAVNRPNVVWIVLDTCRADHLSCYGYGRNTTPNIDRLAARGVMFERHYAQAPSTPQSVPIYMTGRYTAVLYQDPGDLGIWFLREPPKDEKLISTIFSENDYETAIFSASMWAPILCPTGSSAIGSSLETRTTTRS